MVDDVSVANVRWEVKKLGRPALCMDCVVYGSACPGRCKSVGGERGRCP